MKATCIFNHEPTALPQPLFVTVPPSPEPRENIRHILLGSPEAIRQTIHLLHSLHYSETLLWSPVMTIEKALIITPAQGEAMSLLRRQI